MAKSKLKSFHGKSRDPVPTRSQPWIKARTGLIVMGLVSAALAGFMIWQLYPTEGLKSILWGIGAGLAIWAVFTVSVLVNRAVRGE